MKTDTFDRFKIILVDMLECEEDEVTPCSNLYQELGADEFDIVELVMEAEEQFGIDISDEDWEGVQTVQDAVNVINKKRH